MGIQVSVVIPCRNGARTLGEQLEALSAQQTSAEFEVVVADNGSTDDTATVVRNHAAKDARIRLVDASHAKGSNVARNSGVRAAQGELIALCDADDVVQPGWLEAFWQAYRHGASSMGGSIDRVLDDGTVIARDRGLFRSVSGARRGQYADSANCAFAAAAFHAIGGFDEAFSAGSDEIDFFWRLNSNGCAPIYVAQARVVKLMRTDLADARRQYFNYGRGDARLVCKFHPHGITRTRLAVIKGGALMWKCLAGTAIPGTSWHRTVVCSRAWNLGFLCGSRELSPRGKRRHREVQYLP